MHTTHYLNKFLKGGLLVLLVFMFMIPIYGQGWERILGGTKLDEGTDIIETIDRGYLVVGYSESFGADNDLDVYLVKTDVEGELVWGFDYDQGFIEHAYSVLEMEDGSILVVGDIIENAGDDKDVLLLNIDKEGKLIWSKKYGEDEISEAGRSISRGIDGGYIIAGEALDLTTQDEDFFILKVDQNGNEVWKKSFGTTKDDQGRSIATLEKQYVLAGISENSEGFDNDIILYGLDVAGNELWDNEIKSNENEEVFEVIPCQQNTFAVTGFLTDNNDALIAKYDERGQQIWLNSFDGNGLADQGRSIVELKDGSIVMAGITEKSPLNVDFFLVGVSADGEELWRNSTGNPLSTDFSTGITKTVDGGYVFTGRTSQFLDFFDDIVLIKTDSQGDTYTSFLAGNIFQDDCNLFDPSGNLPLENWLVKAEKPGGTFFGSTDKDGFYNIRLDTGMYNVTVFPVNNYWKPCVPGGYVVNINEFYDTTSRNFPITAEINCPYMEVNVSVPFLNDCRKPLDYTVSYCNLGTALARDAFIELTIDDKLTLTSSSVAYAKKIDNTYTFNIGNVAVSECGSFTISTSLTCEGIVPIESYTVQAHIFPDTICTEPDPNWDKSSVIVQGTCQGNSLLFQIENVGDGNMVDARNFIVIEENVIWLEGEFELDANEAFEIPIVNPEGRTYRIVAEQSEGHPGRSFPTVALEACGVPEDGVETSRGFVTQFREDDLNSSVSINVQEYNPSNEVASLRGYPKGYGAEGVIDQETDITYTISFSNFTLDTIDRVIIRDTLPATLDISTVIPGASSHPYTFEIYDQGIIKFTFSKISLIPFDSSANNPSSTSNGFVTFQVSQNPENPQGSVIFNRAAIFFENYAPLITNGTIHSIDVFPGYVEQNTTAIPEFVREKVRITIQPNPFIEETMITIVDEQQLLAINTPVRFELFDMVGRQITTDYFTVNNPYRFSRGQLGGGLYLYRLSQNGELLGSGKILIE